MNIVLKVQKKIRSNTEQPKLGPSKPPTHIQTPARKGKTREQAREKEREKREREMS